MQTMNETVQAKLGALMMALCEAEAVIAQKDEENKRLKNFIAECCKHPEQAGGVESGAAQEMLDIR